MNPEKDKDATAEGESERLKCGTKIHKCVWLRRLCIGHDNDLVYMVIYMV